MVVGSSKTGAVGVDSVGRLTSMGTVAGSTVGRGLKVEKSSSKSKLGVDGVVSESLMVVMVVVVVDGVVDVVRGDEGQAVWGSHHRRKLR